VIRVDNKYHHLGYFLTKEQAAAAYREAALRLHGEFVPVEISQPLTTE
jgi:hypothetical protein